ncbi:MAG: hypothetical protein EBU77_09205 [Betaproteobacteria bacterium]|nr:hypothetical protein [Betaproteobacteria bacterium]
MGHVAAVSLEVARVGQCAVVGTHAIELLQSSNPFMGLAVDDTMSMIAKKLKLYTILSTY